MKIDAMTGAALAFAGFAAWAYLKPKPQANTNSSAALGMLKTQRDLVGSALWQNTDYLKGAAFDVPDNSYWFK